MTFNKNKGEGLRLPGFSLIIELCNQDSNYWNKNKQIGQRN